MRKRFAIAGAVVGLVALSAGLTLSTAFGSRNADTILIGISAAKTGILAPYDLQSGQLFQMRINQINKAGGVLGKQIKVEWIDRGANTVADWDSSSQYVKTLTPAGEYVTASVRVTVTYDWLPEALLGSLAELVPYTLARVIVPEGGPHLLALGEREIPEPPKTLPKYHPGHPLTLVADDCQFLKKVLEEKKSVLIPDTDKEKDWQTFQGHTHLRSWLSVPLKASDEYLGFLSIGHTDPNRYTPDHLRRAELLSIPAAAAIQNARLYSTADMYASELQKRLVDLQEAETALAEAQGDVPSLGDRFEKVFRSSPIPCSITTLREGRFVDVDAAFERRYGYSREELLRETSAAVKKAVKKAVSYQPSAVSEMGLADS